MMKKVLAGIFMFALLVTTAELVSKNGLSKNNKVLIKQKNFKTTKKVPINKGKHWTRSFEEEQADDLRIDRRNLITEEKKSFESDRWHMMAQWKNLRAEVVDRDYEAGKYADLYKVPTWPFYAIFADSKNLFQAEGYFKYATDCFDSSGSTADLSQLIFGERDFTFSDILLSLELRKRNRGSSKGTILVDAGSEFEPIFEDDVNGLWDKKMLFFAESDEYGVSLDFFRYIKNKDIAFGVQLPLAYKAHILKFDVDYPCSLLDSDVAYTKALKNELLKWALLPKGLDYLPKSSITGIGDVSTFINFNINTRYAEKMLLGARVVWPTAKDADVCKLWAPELGSGFTQIMAFTSVLFNPQRSYFNPHMLLQGTFRVAGHKNKRVPRMIKYNGVDPVGTVNYNAVKVMAHGELVAYNGQAFTEPDVTVPAFADNVRSVRIRPGAEVNLRVGNVWEKFIFRRAFLDAFYNFRAKWRDHIGGNLNRCVWLVDRLEERTHQLEHKFGLDFTYQFDIHSRLKTGFEYTFAGINVPEIFKARLVMSVEF